MTNLNVVLKAKETFCSMSLRVLERAGFYIGRNVMVCLDAPQGTPPIWRPKERRSKIRRQNTAKSIDNEPLPQNKAPIYVPGMNRKGK